MDKKSLSYHTKVQDWSQLYRLTADGKIYKDSKEITYLTPQKIQEIDSWRNNVRKKLNKNKSANGQPDQERKLTPAKQKRKGTPNSREGVRSANSRQTVSSTDIYSVSNHLAETSLHYAAMREDIYKANKTKSIHQPTKPILNGTAPEVHKKIDKVIQFENSNDKVKRSGSSWNNKPEEDILSESSTETVSLASTSKMTNRGKVIQVKDKTMISVRSASNNLLNVISIDDCKMALRRQPFLYTANSEVSRSDRNKSETSEFRNTSSTTNSVDLQKLENTSAIMESGKSSTYYPSTVHSRNSSQQKVDRKGRVTKAIDTMVNDRKVMNNMDRNFDARIGSTRRLVLEKNEGGYMFKRLHSALRKHVDNILAVQAHRRSQRKFNGMDDQFSSYIQQIASSMQTGSTNLDEDMYRSHSSSLDEDIYRADSKRHTLKNQSIILEEDENVENDTKPKENGHDNTNYDENIYGNDRHHDYQIFSDNKNTTVLTTENLEKQNGLTEQNANSSGYECSTSTSSISIQNFSDKSKS